MYSTATGGLYSRSMVTGDFIGAPGRNSRQTPLANIDFSYSPGCSNSGRLRALCFQPAFVPSNERKICPNGQQEMPNNKDFQSCISDYSSYPLSATQINQPTVQRVPGSSSMVGEFVSGNAKVIKTLSYDQYSKFRNAVQTESANKETNSMDTICKDGMVLVDVGHGRTEVLCPLPRDYAAEPQYRNALRSLWQPERFAETDQSDAHRLAKELQSCFHNDFVYPNGSISPTAVKMTPMCMAAAESAIRQCASETSQTSKRGLLANEQAYL